MRTYLVRTKKTLLQFAALGFFSMGSTAFAASMPDGVAIATPSLVQVQITPRTSIEGSPDDGKRDDTPNHDAESRQNVLTVASGVIISSDGYILTLCRPVDDGGSIRVWTSDKRAFEAKIIGRDKRRDLALLKIEATGLPPARIGDPMSIPLGERIFSAGVLPESAGLEPIVTDGIISTLAHKRSDGEYFPLIQTTSQVVLSMGGGGLFNEKGELLGISTQMNANKKISPSISFAVPINIALDEVPELKKYGHMPRSAMGVQIANVDDKVVSTMNLPSKSGALVQSVAPHWAADNAGIQPGDIILRINEHKINEAADVPKTMSGIKPGTTVKVELWRQGKTIEKELKTYDGQ